MLNDYNKLIQLIEENKPDYLYDFEWYDNENRNESIRRLEQLSKKEYFDLVKSFIETFNDKGILNDYHKCVCIYLSSVWKIVLDYKLLFQIKHSEAILENRTLDNVSIYRGVDKLTWKIKIEKCVSQRYWLRINLL